MTNRQKGHSPISPDVVVEPPVWVVVEPPDCVVVLVPGLGFVVVVVVGL